jgi:hypothetical protein
MYLKKTENQFWWSRKVTYESYYKDAKFNF